MPSLHTGHLESHCGVFIVAALAYHSRKPLCKRLVKQIPLLFASVCPSASAPKFAFTRLSLGTHPVPQAVSSFWPSCGTCRDGGTRTPGILVPNQARYHCATSRLCYLRPHPWTRTKTPFRPGTSCSAIKLDGVELRDKDSNLDQRIQSPFTCQLVYLAKT